jgi:hypothetical protein
MWSLWGECEGVKHTLERMWGCSIHMCEFEFTVSDTWTNVRIAYTYTWTNVRQQHIHMHECEPLSYIHEICKPVAYINERINLRQFCSQKPVLQSSSSPGDWQMPKHKSVGSIQQLQKRPSSRVRDFARGKMKFKCSEILLLLASIRSQFTCKWDKSAEKIMTLCKTLLQREISGSVTGARLKISTPSKRFQQHWVEIISSKFESGFAIVHICSFT